MRWHRARRDSLRGNLRRRVLGKNACWWRAHYHKFACPPCLSIVWSHTSGPGPYYIFPSENCRTDLSPSRREMSLTLVSKGNRPKLLQVQACTSLCSGTFRRRDCLGLMSRPFVESPWPNRRSMLGSLWSWLPAILLQTNFAYGYARILLLDRVTQQVITKVRFTWSSIRLVSDSHLNESLSPFAKYNLIY